MEATGEVQHYFGRGGVETEVFRTSSNPETKRLLLVDNTPSLEFRYERPGQKAEHILFVLTTLIHLTGKEHK